MPRAESRILLVFLVAVRVLEGDAVIAGTCTAAGVCTPTAAGETHAHRCNSAAVSANCTCDINYEDVAGNCTIIACTANPVSTCGTNTACNAANQCSCAINYEVATSTENQCTAIACTSTNATTCTDAQDYCELSTTTAGTCSCKKNFAGTNAPECSTILCTDDAGCTGVTNSACTGTGSTAVCGCDTLYTADANTGACSTQKNCTVATVTTACGTNTVCEQSQSVFSCFCQSNYKASATGCVQKTCSGTNITNCDANSQCSSDNCVCADNFVINGRVCECPSTGFSLVGGVCKKTCTETSQCGTKGACSNSVCECEPNYEGNAATACTQKACSGTNTTNCASKSSCVSDKCVCTSGSFVADSDPLVCAGCEGIFCNFSLLMASLLMFFFAGKRFE